MITDEQLAAIHRALAAIGRDVPDDRIRELLNNTATAEIKRLREQIEVLKALL